MKHTARVRAECPCPHTVTYRVCTASVPRGVPSIMNSHRAGCNVFNSGQTFQTDAQRRVEIPQLDFSIRGRGLGEGGAYLHWEVKN